MSAVEAPLEVRGHPGAPASAESGRHWLFGRWVRAFGRPRVLVLVCLTALVVGLLTEFAVVIANSQSQSREQTEKRFAAQATISAALTESLFEAGAAPAQAEAAKTFAGKAIAASALSSAVKRSQLAYLLILDGRGKLLAASAGTPPFVRGRVGDLPAHLRDALHGHASLSNVLTGLGQARVLEWALPFKTRYGARVEVRGLSAAPIGQFLSAYLAKLTVGQRDNEVFVIDSSYRLVGSADRTARTGQQLDSVDLRSALAAHSQGVYRRGGVERFFASAPVGGTSWRVLVSTRTKSFYPALADSRRWVIWALFGAFALALAASFHLLRQALRRKSQLAESNRRLAEMNSTPAGQVAERTADAENRSEQLARSNAELEQFGYVASHDLQEPLRKIQAFGDRLEAKYGSQLDEQGQDYLRRMQEAATRSRSLINDLLSFSRVTSRAGSFVPVELTAIAKEAVSDLELQIEELGGRVEIGELPRIDAEPDQMHRLLQNLIGNALKFRREGEPPRVRVHGRLLNGDSARCELTVEDNGIGFDEQYQERIFAIFQRLHSRTEYEGTGIGLAVCRKIVHHHGGTITATSTPGEGSTFVVSLPVHHPEPGAPQ